MKYLLLIMFGAGMVVGSRVYLSHRHKEAEIQPIAVSAAEPTPGVESSPGSAHFSQPAPIQVEATKSVAFPKPSILPVSHGLNHSMVAQSVDLLLSPQASYEQKRAAWKQLREENGLDEAINQLQQRFTSDPARADCAAVLGHAYLQKCGTLSDVREQGILAMQADKLFDTALGLDPQNWEARFTKAVALSYWPATMGKTDEVIDHFTTLVQQQEAQAQQPQFADSYLWLGDQYKKSGRIDDARSVWQRGAYLFPADQKLASRLTSAP